MRRRPPSFPLVLSALVAGAGIAVLVATGSPSTPGTTPTFGLGSAHACATTRARAAVTARSAIVITATARAPVTATQSATGPAGTAVATRSETLSSRFRLTRPVSVTRVAIVAGTACAHGDSPSAAHAAALEHAYAAALRVARARAGQGAAAELGTLQHNLFASVLAQARADAQARAHRLADGALPVLAAQARADARRRAGG